MTRSKSFTLYEIDNKGWTRYLMLPGLFLFIIFIIGMNVQQLLSEEEHKAPHAHSAIYASYFPCEIQSCHVTCSNAPINSMVQNFTNLGDCTQIDLDISNGEFPNKTMSKNWLHGKFRIGILRLSQCDLEVIENEAFSSDIFSEIKILELLSGKLTYFGDSSFKGLNQLNSLNIQWNVRPSHINFSGFLDLVSATISDIALTNLETPISVSEILGTSEFSFLQILDLRSNNFGDLNDSRTFCGCRLVKSLYLSSCRITSIGSSVFNPLTQLQRLELKDNLLKTLPGNVFQNLVLTNGMHIKLGGNLWNCSCELSQISKLYKLYPSVFEDSMICNEPLEFRGKKLTDCDVCGSSTDKMEDTSTATPLPHSITTVETTEACFSSTTSPTTEFPNSTEKTARISCERCLSEDCVGEEEFWYVRPREIDFKIETYSPSQVKVVFESTSEDFALLWFSNASNFRGTESQQIIYGCRSNVGQRDNHFLVGNLSQESTYVFCMIKRGETGISPFNCHSIFVAADGEILESGPRAALIAILSVGILLAIGVGAVIMFCVIRFRPSLIKGNKRVIIVNKSTADVMVLPRNGSTGSSNTGQTTISSKRSIERQLSGGSIESGRSYVIPNTYEIIQSERTEVLRREKIYFEKLPDCTPPPLPKRSSNLSQSFTNPVELRIPGAGNTMELNNGIEVIDKLG